MGPPRDSELEIFEGSKILPAVRQSTRVELYRRLVLARDCIDSSYEKNLTLKDLAEIANLSPHHFLRQFRNLFGMTPHKCLVEKRLMIASKALLESHQSVTQICMSVGFQSLGSFSVLFRKRFGLSPDNYRKQN